ncbi:DUF3310 domain-containing protein [Pseudolactococcus laudensis]|uniref:DUF3310 domain-containing protein n=1 Tax=Pseudolactococcus laudensis TaxID=1494461 RepID=UPI002FC88A2A
MTFKESNVEISENDSINPNHYIFGGIETIEYLKAKLTPEEYRGFLKGNVLKYVSREAEKNGIEDLKKDKWYLDKLIEFENDRKLSPVEAIEISEDLQATYTPKIKMTKKEDEMIKKMKRTPQIGVGIVDYSGREPKVLLSNESYFVDAWLRPELIEVVDG